MEESRLVAVARVTILHYIVIYLGKTIARNTGYHLEVPSRAPHALTILRITYGPYHYAL